ncbi:helix-turn-helix domain-containing protein [Vibrio ishigakensis]|uniref:helix-turn-helix domain-containing protein n=1 Tax=Vibrio ishigakensis TaxID=1481914 RepID=UPI0021C3BBB2|nr:helix-turn-helix domain-containing protein [Vibrio ishigakensis]
MLNRNQAAEYLGVSPGTLAVWASTGRYQLPFVKIGRKVFYRVVDLESFIEQRLFMQTH